LGVRDRTRAERHRIGGPRPRLRASAAHTAWLAAEVAALDGVATENRALVTLYGEERDRLARVAKACIDSGMTEREVEFAQSATTTLAKAIESAFAGVEGITPAHRKRFGQLLRLALQQLQQSAPKPEPVEGESRAPEATLACRSGPFRAPGSLGTVLAGIPVRRLPLRHRFAREADIPRDDAQAMSEAHVEIVRPSLPGVWSAYRGSFAPS
jgi:hypothetical protein